MTVNEDDPLISVVTPSLNQGAFIEKTILSVIEQDYPRIEYIIMDGGSTDDSVQIIRKYESKIAYWQSQPDKGQSAAINDGIKRATGDIIAYINSDDWYLPGAFRTVVDVLKKSDALWLGSTGVNVDPDTGAETDIVPVPPLDDRAKLVAIPWGLHQSGCFWRRQLFEQIGFFREELHCVFDTEFLVRSVVKGFAPVLITEPTAGRLVQKGSKTCMIRPNFVKEQMRFHEFFRPLLTVPEQTELDFWFEWKKFWLSWHGGRRAAASSDFLHLISHFPIRTLREGMSRLIGR